MANKEPQNFPHMIERFISKITLDWPKKSDQAGLFEMRCLGEHRKTVIQRFAPDAVRDAVDFAVRMNEAKLNIYTTINPIDINASISTGKGATDTNILRAHYNFADADDEQGLEGLTELSNLIEPEMAIITGMIPHQRQHAYWSLTKPCEDLELWRSKQVAIAARCGTDPSVVNPSRIMRVAGTVSYPNQAKQIKGYIPELVTMHVRAE
jgi:hypothetical protein